MSTGDRYSNFVLEYDPQSSLMSRNFTFDYCSSSSASKSDLSIRARMVSLGWLSVLSLSGFYFLTWARGSSASNSSNASRDWLSDPSSSYSSLDGFLMAAKDFLIAGLTAWVVILLLVGITCLFLFSSPSMNCSFYVLSSTKGRSDEDFHICNSVVLCAPSLFFWEFLLCKTWLLLNIIWNFLFMRSKFSSLMLV